VSARLALAFALPAIAYGTSRSGLAVRAIRALDRRVGLASARGERAYAGVAGIFAGLQRRVEADVRLELAGGARTLVDIGAGPGHLLAALADLETAELLGIEPSPEMRAIAAGRGVTELDGRAEQLPIETASADLVVSTLSMHHWDDPVAALLEIDRVLRPGAEARLYDVRFAAYSERELAGIAASAGIAPRRVRRRVLSDRLAVFRPYVLIQLTPKEEVS
jgi:SAM-dependent methyltransferase